MPTARNVELVQKLRWHVSGNISPTAFAIGDVDGTGDNAFVIGNLVGELFIFKGNHPQGLPWMTCKGLGTITAVTIGDIRNWGKNSIVVMSAEGLCHIFDVAGLEDESGDAILSGLTMPSVPTAPGVRPGQAPSIYSSTPLQGSYQAPGNSHHGYNINPTHPNLPATPNLRPVPDIHNHHSHHGHHATSHPHHGTPPLPPPAQNTPHGSASSSASGFQHQTNTPNNTPIHSHSGSIHGGTGGVRRGSEAFVGPGSAARTTAVLASLIGTPPTTNTLQGSGAASTHHTRSIGASSAANSPTGTPLLKPQHIPSISGAPGSSAKDHALKKNHAGSTRHGASGRTQVRDINGRRVLDRPNLTLPVPVNINRAYIADIDGDGLNEIVLARTDRILHSYSLQTSKETSPTIANHPNNQPLNPAKLRRRTESVSTLDSSGLLSPLDDRNENVIYYPSLSSMGRQYYAGSAAAMASVGATQGNSDAQDNGGIGDPSSRLLLVEKKRWALDGQIHCLAVTKDIHTEMPILLVAQPGLKFIMVDHTGNMSEPVTQVQRNPRTAVNVVGPDTPTRSVGTGDVATDIICGTHYVNGEKKDIIGLMSMDGAFALHDLENNTVKVHDLDSTHKIFGFSKLNFGNNDLEQQTRDSWMAESVYGRGINRRADESNACDDDDVDDIDSNDGETFAETMTLGHGDCSDGEDSRYSRRTRRTRRRSARKLTPSMLISEPYGSRFPKDDMFVGCSWSGITFFIDQDFNTAQYDFDARVCAFGAGQYAITPGRNEPCLFYVDFEDNIYVYYNLYIQTEPSVQFLDVVKADPTLVRASQKIGLESAVDKDHERPEGSPESAEVAQPNPEDASSTNIPDYRRLPTSELSERDMKIFIHESLYNVNQYEDEFQRLKRLADIERAKRAAFLEAEAIKDRVQRETELKAVVESAAALAGAAAAAVTTKESPTFMDPRLRRPPHVLTADVAAGLDPNSGPEMTHSLSRGKAAQRGQFSGHGITTSPHSLARQGVVNQGDDDDNGDQLSPLSPVSPISLSSPKPRKAYHGTRRSSLLIKDVLSHYEGKITPPLNSPTSPSASSSLMSKDFKSGSSPATGPSTGLTNIIKRFSLMEVNNGGRASRSSTTSSGSSSSVSNSSQSTITPGHPLTKGKGLEARVGKALRPNRPAGVSRNRPLGVMGRKLGARSRLSLQQDREDDTEEGDEDEAPSEDGTGDTDGDNLAEFDRSSRKSAGEDDQDFEAELAAEDFYNHDRASAGNEGEEGTPGVYTPSTISPIPSPGRLYGSQHGNMAEPSASLDGTAYMLSRGLLSPTRSTLGGTTAATSTAGAVGKTSRQSDQDYYGPSSLSSSHGHARQRSGHGLLDSGLGQLQTREIAASSGIGSGPNSAGHSSVQEGRRSRAESVLSTGSDIGGMIVPDITLLASSFPNQPSAPFSMSDSLMQEEPLVNESDESDDDIANDVRDDHGNSDSAGLADSKERSAVLRSGVRRPPRRSATLGSQDGATLGTGSGSDTATGKSISQPGQSSGEGQTAALKSDVKLLPAPLPRSNHHHRRHQLEQQGSSGSPTGSYSSKDPVHSTSAHVSPTSSVRPNSAIGGGAETRDGMHGGGEGFGRGPSGKASSTTSSTTVSDRGSGPSSPLGSNVSVSNAILSNPSSNSYKGFSVLSLPLTSPSASTASVQQHHYFAPLHYYQSALSPHPNLGSSAHSSSRGVDRGGAYEDDRISVRSRTSTYRGNEDNNDISSTFAATSPLTGSGSEHGQYRISPTSTSSSHLVSDSLVRRLEELQQQDRDLEERQRQKEREKDKDREREKEKEKDRPRSGQSSRPSPLSRANSGASIQSAVSYHRTPVSHPPTSHGSATGSNNGSGPVSGSGSVSGPASGSAPGSGPTSSLGRQGWDSEDQPDSGKRMKMRPGLGQGL